jgi:hypothetical protein
LSGEGEELLEDGPSAIIVYVSIYNPFIEEAVPHGFLQALPSAYADTWATGGFQVEDVILTIKPENDGHVIEF